MPRTAVVTENDLDNWVRSHANEAQSAIVELVYRLIAASCPGSERRIPRGDSIGQHGPDGVVTSERGFEPFVPPGQSIWEIGTSLNPGSKATRDYRDATRDTCETIRSDSTFVVCQPLSGRRGWEGGWKEDQQHAWRDKRRKLNEWADVRVIDGTVLVDWLANFPAVENWLGEVMGNPMAAVTTPDREWFRLSALGDPLPLSPGVFVAGRDAASERLVAAFSARSAQLRLNTLYPDQMVDFVAALVGGLEPEEQSETANRALIINAEDAFLTFAESLGHRHTLIADFDIGTAQGGRGVDVAIQQGHSVVFAGPPGGLPHGNSVDLPQPKPYQVREALVEGGYPEELARTLSNKCDGNLGVLLRVIRGLSASPDWAQGSAVSELAIATLLGSWDEGSEGDRAVAEAVAGKVYGEWIGALRDVVLSASTPLTQRDGKWKVVSRYEAWWELGPRVFDADIDRLTGQALAVLREPDPQFDLEPDERFMAMAKGKIPAHSAGLRRGIAETAALLGSLPKALTSTSVHKAEGAARELVRHTLEGADWKTWASLSSNLSLIAEASPEMFLDAVESGLREDPSSLDQLMKQESGGFGGSNPVSGLLWALEVCAWHENLLPRVMLTLADLADRDPGGQWANRPANSLTSIVLPWFPQTAADVEVRLSSVKAIAEEFPDVGWDLLQSLLPETHMSATANPRPQWREWIPENWSDRVTNADYARQVEAYALMAIEIAQSDPRRWPSLVERLDDLSPAARETILQYLQSPPVAELPEEDRYAIWDQLLDLATRHRKYSETAWALPTPQVASIESVAEHLQPMSPALRARRLFTERAADLYEEVGNWREQEEALEARREQAVGEVYGVGDVDAVLELAESSESPWRVGFAFGVAAPPEAEPTILPSRLRMRPVTPREQFSAGFVMGRFSDGAWAWVDQLPLHEWQPNESSAFLALVPFSQETWKRVDRGGPEVAAQYWAGVHVNPYQAESGLDLAIQSLLEHGRPIAAIDCLARQVHSDQPVDTDLAVKALLDAPSSDDGRIDTYDATELISKLQGSDVGDEDMCRIEWAYLPLLERVSSDAQPLRLEGRLARDPSFFCEVIRTVFRPTSRDTAEDRAGPEASENTSEASKFMAENAYRLLSNWRRPPGVRDDGSVDAAQLEEWVVDMKEEASSTGHTEISLSMTGQVFASAPQDPDGLWIDRNVAKVLNDRDHDEMRNGFAVALLNARGVHTYTAGEAERELAESYREKARALQVAGFPRLAGEVMGLADSYEWDAEREESRDLDG